MINKQDRARTFLTIVFFLSICLAFSVWAALRGMCSNQKNPLKLLFFFSEECDQCHYVDQVILKGLEAKYPIIVERISIDTPEGYERLLAIEEETGDHGNEIPAIFAGKKGMGGVEEIESELENTVRNLIANVNGQGEGTAVSQDITTQSPINIRGEQPPAKEKATPPPVYVAFFTKKGCMECNRAYRDIQYLQSKYHTLRIQTFDIAEPESKTLNEALGTICGVPEKSRLLSPALFIGKDYLLQGEITVNAIEELINKYTQSPSLPPWEAAKGLQEKAEHSIINRFKSLSISAIILAGLLDGINPCAFATIIFFISYLTYIGRKGREILFVGSAFTFSVFITYMLIGLGFFSFINSISFLPFLSKIVYLGTATFALVLGVLSLRDFFICKAGKTSDMSLQLPNFLKKRIHNAIRKEAKLKRYVLGAMITGFIISVLELACTGQVYLPTIIFVTRVSTLKIRSFLYLLMYNVMFISPLVVIFLTVSKGTSSQQLTAIFQKSSAGIKLGMSLLFFTLAAILFISMI